MILGLKKKLKPANQLSIRDFATKRNKIVIIRNARGIGDILNCRMLFNNFKKLNPEIKITFACYKEYEDLVKGHPAVDNVVCIEDLNKDDYLASYDISNCCILYESREMGKNVKHRAEIWANHCGISLDNTDMNLPFISSEKICDGYLAVKQLRSMSLSKYNKDGPSVFFSPLAYESLRSLTPEQINGTLKMLRSKGLFVYSAHSKPLKIFQEMDIPLLVGSTLEDWMSYIHAADYVVTVDTANFHYAGGIKKPLTGIFTHVDGKLRGKFYDFVLVQKHRDNGNWPCGPCYNFLYCTHPKCHAPVIGPHGQRTADGTRPCSTELTLTEIEEGVDKMLKKWAI